MDFNLDEAQQEIADLARRILEDRVTHLSIKTNEAGTEWFDRDTWNELAKAGLVGIALREDVGGGGMGMVELGQVCEAQGITVAPIPLVPTVAAALAIDQFGTVSQRQAWLPGVSDGSTVLSVALQEYGNDNLESPTIRAEANGDGWSITGTKVMVEYAHHASRGRSERLRFSGRWDRASPWWVASPRDESRCTSSNSTARPVNCWARLPKATPCWCGCTNDCWEWCARCRSA